MNAVWAYGAAVTMALVCAACADKPALLRVVDAQQRTATALVEMVKASDGTNRAVMADTDEASTQAAAEADRAKDAVQREIDTLRPLLEGLQFGEEHQRLEDFARAFASYRELDARILTLAVENTNLKAQRLSFGAAATAADALVTSVERIQATGVRKWHVEAMKFEVVAATREMQVLQAPHIAEAGEPSMDRIEARMQAAQTRAREALTGLRGLASASRAGLDDAEDRLAAFLAVHAQILELSRRNTNVRSLALVLNDKGKAFASCERSLQALDAALDQRMSVGAR